MRMKNLLILAAILVVGLPVAAEEEPAQTSSSSDFGYRGWGLRVGVSSDPDQVVGGAQFNFGRIAGGLRFQPDVQLGLGDDVTSLYATAPVYYRFQAEQRFTPYAGGGIALGYVDVDLPAGSSDSEFEVGGRLTGGLEWGRSGGGAFAVELSLGVGDVHDFHVVALWNFGK